MQKIEREAGVFTIHGVLAPEECGACMTQSEDLHYEEAPIQRHEGAVLVKDVRNNDRVIFDDEGLAARLFARLQPLLPAQIDEWALVGLNERFRYYRYRPGQYFKWHTDGFYARHRDEVSQLTLLLYLNDDYEGGDTEFRWMSVRPATGMVLVFPHLLMHQGAPVTAGVKYVLRTDVMYRRQASINGGE